MIFPHLFLNLTLDASLNKPCLFCIHKQKHTSNTLKSLHRILSDESRVGSAFTSVPHFQMCVSLSACVGSGRAACILAIIACCLYGKTNERPEVLRNGKRKKRILVDSCDFEELCVFNCWVYFFYLVVGENQNPSKLSPQFSNKVLWTINLTY